MSSRSDILIIGGGVIGAACALELATRGAGVTLVERGEIGRGCSYGNAGWLTPSLATPLPAPGMLLTCLKWMADPESPLYIHPRPSLDLARWLLRFARSMNGADFERGSRALIALSKWSLEAYERMSRELPDSFGFERRGLLMLGLTGAGVASAQRELELAGRHGLAGTPLDADAVRALEPAITGRVAGGVHFTGEGHLEPLAAVRAMTAEAERRGARVLQGCEVFGADVAGSRLEGLRTTRGRLTADRYVLAAGSWSKGLAAGLRLRLPVLGGKGYAIVVPPTDPMPHLPIKVTELRVAITPRQGSLRLAGTLEVVDGDESISPRRVEAIVRGARQVLSVPAEPEIVEVWRGLRPCTPDGMPVIGFARSPSNLLVATGHQMCGVHTAPATGRLAADLLTGEAPLFDPAPFRADRF
jgi:D-amino-acid dehydrogenase